VKFSLLVPGPINQLTGGYLFARHLVEGLRSDGDTVGVIELAGRYPDADAAACRAAAQALASLPDGETAVIDGLALLAFRDCLAREAKRLKLIGFVHHPLADETGLPSDVAARFRAAEQNLSPLLRGAVCPSRATAGALVRYGVAGDRVSITPPGTAKPAAIRFRDTERRPLRLLSVAAVTPRKGHRLLIEALATLDLATWQLDCIGSIARDPACVTQLRRAIAARGLEDNVRLMDERPATLLAPAYDEADLFVLPSYHEGYGMAFAEALAHGLPIVATNAGALPETVPESAGILVPPGDAAALATALARVINDRALLAKLGEGARGAGAALPDWPQAVGGWRAALTRLTM
jgi:glycosyltransferase involved in cell wall biosynthesis